MPRRTLIKEALHYAVQDIRSHPGGKGYFLYQVSLNGIRLRFFIQA